MGRILCIYSIVWHFYARITTDGFIAFPHALGGLDAPSSLQALQHVYRRGLDWFQEHRAFRLGLGMCFGPFGTCGRTPLWMKRTALLGSLMNDTDCEHPSCLRVLQHLN